MCDIKLITEDTDLTTLEIIPFDWDLEVYDRPYNVVRIAGYAHSVGSSTNELWCYPADETMTVYNLIQYSGHAPTWGIVCNEVNRSRTKWSNTEIRRGAQCYITRNGKKFYQIQAGNMDFALTKAKSILTKLDEHCIPFHERNWKDGLIGRKIFYNNEPAKIEYINAHDGRVDAWIVPDGIERFSPPVYIANDPDLDDLENWVEEYSTGLIIDLIELDKVWWWRK